MLLLIWESTLSTSPSCRAARFGTTKRCHSTDQKHGGALGLARLADAGGPGWLLLCQRSEPVTEPALCWMVGSPVMPDTGDGEAGYVEWRFQHLHPV